MNSASRFASSEAPNQRPRSELQAEIDAQTQEFLARGGKIKSAEPTKYDARINSRRWNGSKPIGADE